MSLCELYIARTSYHACFGVNERQRIAELLDTLEMGGVASDQLQAVLDSDGGDHGIGRADGLPRAFQLTCDVSGQFRIGFVKWKHFLRGKSRDEGLQLTGRLFLLVALYDLHHGDGSDGV
jgi:hypothetical protein